MEADRIALICEDAGPAAALVFVARELQRRGHVLFIWATGLAEEAFAREGLPVRHFDESWLGCLPAVAVTGSTAWGERIDACAVRAARHAGIPTLTYVDFWLHYAERFSHRSPLDSLPDVIAVVDDQMRLGVIAAGASPERIVVTGSPLLDAAARIVRIPAQMGAPFLFLSQPFEALYGPSSTSGHPLGYTESDVLPLLARVAHELGVKLRVRAHPREDVSALRARLETAPGSPILSEGRTLREDIAQSRAVVGMTTIALVEAGLMGRPSLSVQLTHVPLRLPTFETGQTALAQEEQAVARWVNAVVRGEEIGREVAQGGESLPPPSKVSAERFADAVERLLARVGQAS